VSDITDRTSELQDQLDALAAAQWGTLALPDEAFGLSRTLTIPVGVSVVMRPTTKLVALPGFSGDVMLELEPYPKPGEGRQAGWQPRRIMGGMIDGNEQPVIGLRTIRDREIDLTDITFRNCLRKGVEIGTETGCEVNLRSVRIQCERGIVAEADSVGIHYLKCTDSLVSQATVIGYGVGVQSESSSNDFHQIHVWNYDQNCKLRTCFECNGWNDSYSQCYADSPINGDDEGVGFHVTRPFQRFSDCRVYLNQWVTPNRVVGVRIAPGGSHSTYTGMHFTARAGHPFRAAFTGSLEAATIIGCTYPRGLTEADGAVNQLPSRGGGATQMPPLRIGPAALRPVQ